MRLFIEPTETLLFRTGRPFDAGEIGYAETMFPPTPETIQGALRAMIASRWNPGKPLSDVFLQQALIDLIGDSGPEHYGRFRMTNFTLGQRDGSGNVVLLYPVPSHIIQERDTRKPLRLTPKSAKEMEYVKGSNIPEAMQFLTLDETPKSKLEPLKGWLTEEHLHKVLSLDPNLSQLNFISQDIIYTYEPRMGIGIENSSKRTKDGLLYQAQMVRMQPSYGFIVDIHLSQDTKGGGTNTFTIDDTEAKNLLKLPDVDSWGWIILGGEQRAARFTMLAPSTSVQKRSGRLLYLATPAYFQTGWQPPSQFTAGKSPVAAAISHYHRIGGWSLDPKSGGGVNKTMRRCVPAGSVYFFDEPVTITQPLTEYGKEIGYGITYTGDWSK